MQHRFLCVVILLCLLGVGEETWHLENKQKWNPVYSWLLRDMKNLICDYSWLFVNIGGFENSRNLCRFMIICDYLCHEQAKIPAKGFAAVFMTCTDYIKPPDVEKPAAQKQLIAHPNKSGHPSLQRCPLKAYITFLRWQKKRSQDLPPCIGQGKAVLDSGAPRDGGMELRARGTHFEREIRLLQSHEVPPVRVADIILWKSVPDGHRHALSLHAQPLVAGVLGLAVLWVSEFAQQCLNTGHGGRVPHLGLDVGGGDDAVAVQQQHLQTCAWGGGLPQSKYAGWYLWVYTLL